MSDQDFGPEPSAVPPAGDDYPLRHTAAMLNDRLGLYLSQEQQRGLATGLLVGATLGAAILAWGVVGAIRRDD